MNKTYVPNKKDHFHHGRSKIASKTKAAILVEKELSKASGVIVHGGMQDLKMLTRIGVEVDMSTIVYDTQKLFSKMLGVRGRYKLGRVSSFLKHELLDAHNAGNDAFATAMAFIGMRKIIEAEQKLSYTGHRKCGSLILDTVEVSDQKPVDVTPGFWDNLLSGWPTRGLKIWTQPAQKSERM